MLQDFKDAIVRWGSSTTERQKLQHAYLTLTIAAILVAGIVSLINANQGHRITYIALAAISVFIINAFVWNLLNSILLSKLPTRPKRK